MYGCMLTVRVSTVSITLNSLLLFADRLPMKLWIFRTIQDLNTVLSATVTVRIVVQQSRSIIGLIIKAKHETGLVIESESCPELDGIMKYCNECRGA
jgi:hypothetical protein